MSRTARTPARFRASSEWWRSNLAPRPSAHADLASAPCPASYTRVSPKVGARMYADAWALAGQALSRKVRQHVAR